MRQIAILGSTGSIGWNALRVIRALPREFRVAALSAHTDCAGLNRQVSQFRPALACIADPEAAGRFRQARGGLRTRFLSGPRGLTAIIRDRRVDTVVMAISGAAALEPLLEAIDAGKRICLANKEALVMAGEIVFRKARRSKAEIIPVDSEQSAIWQCLQGQERAKVKAVYLTASGGPFRDLSKQRLARITRREALLHPRWKMGEKITVDSATLMNKGLEVLEAMYLFGLRPCQIKVIIHPESIIHSMVEFVDGVVMAQLAITDMRIPIQYALSYPARLPVRLRGLDFAGLKQLHFAAPDTDRFPCLALAYRAARVGGTMPCVLNAANEVCVSAFLEGLLPFTGIAAVIRRVMDSHQPVKRPGLDKIMAADRWARIAAGGFLIKS